MATETIVTLTDSLDSRVSTGVETVTFFDPIFGIKREIELSEQNRKHFGNLIEKMQKYIDASEVVEVPVVEVVKPKAAAKNNETSKIREWAKANGFTIGDRGRISADIQAAYQAAQEVIQPDAEVVQDLVIEAPEQDDVTEVVETTELDDAEIMQLMAEIEAENNGEPVSLDQLVDTE